MSMVAEVVDHEVIEQVPGGTDLIEWFGGRVPSFHDAEVIEVALERSEARCRLKVHTFQPTTDLDSKGFYININHVVVTFEFANVVELELSGFNHQNVIDGLYLTRLPNGDLRLTLEPCYGLSGEITAKNLQISLAPGVPPNSVYLQNVQAL